jgi:hypothetical protein
MGIGEDALRLHFNDGKISLTLRIQKHELQLNSIEQVPGLLKVKAEQMEWSLQDLKKRE